VVFLSGRESVHVFIGCLYLYCRYRSNYQRGLGIPSICLAPPHFCVRPMPGPGFPSAYAMVFFVLNDLRRGMISVVLSIFVELMTIAVLNFAFECENHIGRSKYFSFSLHFKLSYL